MIFLFNASSESAIDATFESLAKQGVGGLLSDTDTFFYSRRDRIVALATRHAVPAFYFAREFAAAGGLMSYGPSFTGEWRQTGIYAGRILRGIKPAGHAADTIRTRDQPQDCNGTRSLALADEVIG